MMYRVFAALTMSLGVALTLASNQALGGSAHGVVSASTHPNFRPSVARLSHHRNVRNFGNFFPGFGGFYWDPSYGQPSVDVTPPVSGPASNDINYTYKYDVPWDWAHRFPPGYFGGPPAPSHSPPVAYVPGCSTQTVTVPGADGKDQTVNMVRC